MPRSTNSWRTSSRRSGRRLSAPADSPSSSGRPSYTSADFVPRSPSSSSKQDGKWALRCPSRRHQHGSNGAWSSSSFGRFRRPWPTSASIQTPAASSSTSLLWGTFLLALCTTTGVASTSRNSPRATPRSLVWDWLRWWSSRGIRRHHRDLLLPRERNRGLVSGAGQTRPARLAIMTASRRVWAPSVRMRLATWFRTVVMLIPRVCAISRVDLPSANSASTSNCRPVSSV